MPLPTRSNANGDRREVLGGWGDSPHGRLWPGANHSNRAGHGGAIHATSIGAG